MAARLPLALAVAGLVIAGSALGALRDASAAARRSPHPNIVLIRSDDETTRELTSATMPHTLRRLSRHGTEFTDSLVSDPQCCPSRAAGLTGQYAHNNGVFSNHAGYRALRHKFNVLPAWLQEAGYRTAHLGKFLNGYSHAVANGAAVAPGWDEWFTAFSGASNYYDYTVSKNGDRVHFGRRAHDNLTRVMNHEAVHLIHRFGSRRKPLYLQLDQRAPHFSDGPTKGHCRGRAPQPLHADLGRFRGTPLPQVPSFNEPDMTDKPSFLQRPPLRPTMIREMRMNYQCVLESLRGVDRGVNMIFKALKRVGALGRTIIIFTSDNGHFFGEHRKVGGKSLAYEESIRVPLLIRVPPAYRNGASRVGRVTTPVANIDLAPTIARFAHARPCAAPGRCRVMDGRSLVPLLRGRNPSWSRDRGVLTEFKELPRPKGNVCAYTGIRLANRIFVQYSSATRPRGHRCRSTRESELYDLARDPFELSNLSNDPGEATEKAKLKARLAKLQNCAGIAGRDRAVNGHPFCE